NFSFFILLPDPAPRPFQSLAPLAGGAPSPHFRQPGGLLRRRLGNLLLDVSQVPCVVLADRTHVHTASAAGVRAHPTQQRLPEIESITAAQQRNLLVRTPRAQDVADVRHYVGEAVGRGVGGTLLLVQPPLEDGIPGAGHQAPPTLFPRAQRF